ncbi:MAG: peptidoglycan DD-metalloendopeptidase family protein [bacterium]
MVTKPKAKRYYSIMVVPHDARGKPISIKVPASLVYIIGSVLVLAFFIFSSSLLYSTALSRRLVDYARMINETKKQEQVISSFSNKAEKVDKAIEELSQKENELRKALGLKSWKSKITLSKQKSSVYFDRIDLKIAEREKSLEELKSWVETVRARFASTPQSWPIFGRIVSRMGYRTYPWRGYHTGIDIRARYGAPARATANGVVTFTGWRTGYGKTVEISHGNGISTLYAHSSGFAVRPGERVKKGQIISYVGMTGRTTGPHLHYEVRKWSTPVNPVAYLDLNILTASRLWR